MSALTPRPGIMKIAPYVPGKDSIDGKETIAKLSSNEGALGPSPKAMAAYAKAASELHRYPDGDTAKLRKALGRHYGLDPARIVCGAGSDEILNLLVRAYCGPGDELLYSQYGFLMYAINALGVGATPVAAPAKGYGSDIDAMLAAVTDKTRIVCLANPNNPTGTYVSKDDVRRLHAGLPKNVLLIIDAAYAEYVSRNDYESGVELVDQAENVVMTRTFSKIYGLGGLRLGWMYGPAGIVDVMSRLRQPFNEARARAGAERRQLRAGRLRLEGTRRRGQRMADERRPDPAPRGGLRPARAPAHHGGNRGRGEGGAGFAGPLRGGEMTEPLFDKIALIGIGLIGGSIALEARKRGLARSIVAATRSPETAALANRLKLADHCGTDLAEACKDADLVIVCTPVGACGAATKAIASSLKPGCIVSDVGSVKQTVIADMAPHIPKGVHFVPAHPVAGTENSGPEAALLDLFQGRWCILTPLPDSDEAAVARLEAFWTGLGSQVERIDAKDHDRILAITSHLPHLIAYTIVGTADDLGGHLNSEVLKFAAGGFRDFTRIAASDPTMWRDVFMNNREAVLEVLQRFQEDLFYLQRAIRWGEGDKLFDLFTRTREIRRALIHLNQA
jgi:histidinol-phosphate aminotransferase